MAESKLVQTQDQLNCAICLEILRNPVTTTCGHSFCMQCINNCWDQEDYKKTYRCPQCRQTFSPRPVMKKNIILAEVVENLQNLNMKDVVECDFCTGTKNKAIKSCVTCSASLCKTHLQPHYQLPVLKKHKLIEPSRRLQDQICSQHDEALKIYCRTDQMCICTLCLLDKHKGHDTTSAAAERTQKQKQLLEIQRKFQKKIQNKEKELDDLIKAVETHKRSAQTAVKNIEKIQTELINLINRKCSAMKEMIRDQEKLEVKQTERLLNRLMTEILELKKKSAELMELSNTDDPVRFLQSFQSLSTLAGETDAIKITSFVSFDDVTESVSQLRENVEEFWKQQCEMIPHEVKKVQIIHPEIRDDFLHYFCRFTLDPNTAHEILILSEERRVVSWSDTSHSYPEHPDRFNHWFQVLCSESVCESVCGRCYWEVEWSGRDDGDYVALIAVSYKSISRKGTGRECVFGYNNQSWSLVCSPSNFSFLHNNIKTKIPIIPSSCRIGVYVDYEAGSLFFYQVSDTMKLLHTVQTKFTRTLVPGFYICPGTEVKLLEPTN